MRGMIEIFRTGSAPGREHPDERVAGLVVGGAPLVGRREQQLARRSELDLLERVAEVAHRHLLVLAARGEQRRLVREVGEVCADHAGRRRRERVEVDVRREREAARVDAQDLLAAVLVRRLNRHAAVEASRPQQRRVEHVGPVRRREDDDAGGGVEAVHLGQDLVERLLALVVGAAEGARAARAADRVDLVDEDDRRGRVPSPARTGRGRGRRRRRRSSRRTPTPTSRRTGTPASPATARASSVLPVPGVAGQQDAARDARAELAVLVRVAEEVDDLGQLLLRLVDAGDVRERDALGRRLVLLRLRGRRRRTCCRCPSAA